jgi:hypothetical protein
MASTKCFMPFQNGNSELITKGDVIELADGTKFTFIEMKRTKWVGQNEAGQMFNVPVYRDKMGTMPYAKGKVGRNEEVVVKSENPHKFNAGQLFAIENAKETFMFKEIRHGRGKEKVVAIDLATGRTWTLDTTFTYKKIHVNKMREEIR